MAQTTVLANIQTSLASNNEERLRDIVVHEHAADLANEVAALKPADAARVIQLMPAEKQGAVFGYLPAELQTGIAVQLSRQELVIVVSAMPHDERADLYKRLPPLEREALLPALAQAEREDIRKLAGYSEGTAGAVMTSDYATLPRNLTVSEAIEKLRQEAPDAETIYQAYVVDIERRLLGVVSLRDLIVAAAGLKMADLMKRDMVSGRVDEPAEAIARRIAEYDLLALPITDAEGRLVGIVTQDDAMDIASEDASELMYRKAGLTDAMKIRDHIRSEKLTQGSIWYPIRVRLLFLLVTLAGGLAVGTLIDAFEDVLMAVVAVAIFIPLIMDMGGNVGTQSTTIFARGFALGHIQLDRFKAYFLREASVGLVMGVVIGIAAGVIAYYWQGVPNGVPELGIAVGVALFTTVTLACMLGFLLPYAMVKVGIDHAPGADPFITTIKDFSGLAVYFFLVAWLLGLEI
jgi:magnesium transporter